MDEFEQPKTYEELKQLAKQQAEHIVVLGRNIEQNRKRLRNILTSIPLGLIVVDEKDEIQAVNPQVQEIFQFESDELVGRHVSFLFPELKEIGLTQKPLKTSAVRKSTEAFTVEIIVNHFEERGQKSKFIHLQDITERYRLEQLRKDLVAMVSHDLRTPLTAIQGTLTMLEQGVYGDLRDNGTRAIDRAQQSTDYLIGLVKDLLDSAKLESGTIEIEFSETTSGKVVEKAVETSRVQAKNRGVEIVTDFTNDIFMGEEDRVVQVLINLITNAIKYSPEEGKIFVNAGLEGTSVKFSVKDQGPGIPKEMQTRVFERYQQLNQPSETQRKGFGLGLAICKALIEGHKGKIWVESEAGKGSKFCFTIPMSQDD